LLPFGKSRRRGKEISDIKKTYVEMKEKKAGRKKSKQN
jgi:hypothetical protein